MLWPTRVRFHCAHMCARIGVDFERRSCSNYAKLVKSVNERLPQLKESLPPGLVLIVDNGGGMDPQDLSTMMFAGRISECSETFSQRLNRLALKDTQPAKAMGCFLRRGAIIAEFVGGAWSRSAHSSFGWCCSRWYQASMSQ